MSKAGQRRLKSPIRCPDCGKGFNAFENLRRHARLTGCDIREFETKLLRDLLSSMFRDKQSRNSKG